ncbi:MAG: glutaredoxin family protein [Solirubrobacterales bacterium]|jgi:glutaredoxin
MTSTVVVYSRPGCHLCEQALAEIVDLHRHGYRFELHEIDIESEDLLLREMLERIPVVEVDGAVVSELVLDRAALRARLDTVPGDDDRAGGRGA